MLNLFDRGKRRSNEKFIEAVAVKVGSCKGPAEVLANTSLGTPDNFFLLKFLKGLDGISDISEIGGAYLTTLNIQN